ncbi:substrate-binding periplasmic protein [Vogesella oryzae]|uniref:substrate-binding periplasmic protein n=1 Tax=Vogesella oryzae TaxID=1735285 RepID=UPI001582BB06|nr:transporter substrate-binding domain-containing protein [Vogesella oryzae]
MPRCLPALALFCLLPLAHAQQAQLQIAIDANNPPFMYADRSGRPAGLYAEQLQALSKRSGIAISIEAMPWKRALAYLERGSHGVAGIYSNAERQKRYLFSKPLHQEVLMVYGRKSAGTPRYSSIASFGGRRVGVLSGWFYSEEFSKARDSGALQADEASRDAQNVEKLRLGRLDYMIGIRESIAPLMADQLEELGVFATNPTYIALPRSAANLQLLQRINQALPPVGDAP